MAFDFKKEYKEFYMPKSQPAIVNVPRANYIAIRGKGNPQHDYTNPVFFHGGFAITVWL